MARNTPKMTLYEVTKKVAKINKSRTRRDENVPPKVPEPIKTEKKPDMSIRATQARPQRRPLLASYKRRRNLLTRPYVVLVLALGIILAVWAISRSPNDAEITPEPQNGATEAGEGTTVAEPEVKKPVADPVMNVTDAPPTVMAGDHVVVLAHYISKGELEQVEAHFAENGVETVIQKNGAYYVLVTKNRYNNPNNKGTDGYAAIQMLKQVGAKYKAPPGYKGFTFNDIYGDKVD